MRKQTSFRPKGGNSHGFVSGHWKADKPGKPIPEIPGSGQAPPPCEEAIGLGGRRRNPATAANLEARDRALQLRRF